MREREGWSDPGSVRALRSREMHGLDVGVTQVTEPATDRPGSGPPPNRRPHARIDVLPILIVLALVAVGEIVVRLEIVSPFLLPTPTSVVAALWELFGDPDFWSSTRATVVETLSGFAIGTVIGLVLGGAIAVSPFLRRGMHPYIILFQSLPKTALAPTFLLWFGFGMASKVVHAAAIAFFPVLINTVAGFDSVSAASRLLMRSYGASRRQMLSKVALPDSLPTILAGIKTAMSLALIGAIVSELIGAREGLGFLIQFYSFRFRMDMVFALLVVLALVGLALYWAIEWVDRRLVFWRGSRAA